MTGMSEAENMIDITDISREIDAGEWDLMLMEMVQDSENAELTIVDIKCRLAEEIANDCNRAIRAAIDEMGPPYLKSVASPAWLSTIMFILSLTLGMVLA
jgi:hypothetical protein